MLIEKVYITADTDKESIFYDICLNWYSEFFFLLILYYCDSSYWQLESQYHLY